MGPNARRATNASINGLTDGQDRSTGVGCAPSAGAQHPELESTLDEVAPRQRDRDAFRVFMQLIEHHEQG
ncbi:MAG: hypothetical protein EA388_08855 [Nitriliruptor sp.]|nr:MAG: hypothetical protein EA388_08855 [Nitriliruptor sp.]